MIRNPLAVLAACLAIVSSPSASACGDSLYRVGKGIAYRGYSAPLPGSVLIYADGAEARELAEQLAASGHDVHYTDDAATLNSGLRSPDYDVVIAPYRQHKFVEAGMVLSMATYLPVAVTKEEAALAKRSYPDVMIADRDDIKDFLKAIHKTMKRKRS